MGECVEEGRVSGLEDGAGKGAGVYKEVFDAEGGVENKAVEAGAIVIGVDVGREDL